MYKRRLVVISPLVWTVKILWSVWKNSFRGNWKCLRIGYAYYIAKGNNEGVRRQASIVKHKYHGNKLRRFDDASASFDSIIDEWFVLCRQLMDGTLEENGLLDGSRIILLPSVETGLLVRTWRSFASIYSVPHDNHVFHNIQIIIILITFKWLCFY